MLCIKHLVYHQGRKAGLYIKHLVYHQGRKAGFKAAFALLMRLAAQITYY
jgi:hypothetical protein